MLAILAKVANQLERDGHIELADQVDNIIEAIGAREPFGVSEPGALWSEEQEGMEPLEEEEVEVDRLVARDPEDVGMGYSPSFSDILLDHSAPFERYILQHPLVKHLLHTGRDPDLADEGLKDALLDDLEHFFEEMSASGKYQVRRDDGFLETARHFISDTLNRAAAPSA